LTVSDAESVALPMRREPLLVSFPSILRIVPPPPPLRSTRSSPLLSRKVATVFLPADLKRRPDESVMELTVPIEAEATARPLAIVTSELAPGTPTGFQLSASAQSELTAAVHVDLLMMRLPYLLSLIATRPPPFSGEGRRGLRRISPACRSRCRGRG